MTKEAIYSVFPKSSEVNRYVTLQVTSAKYSLHTGKWPTVSIPCEELSQREHTCVTCPQVTNGPRSPIEHCQHLGLLPPPNGHHLDLQHHHCGIWPTWDRMWLESHSMCAPGSKFCRSIVFVRFHVCVAVVYSFLIHCCIKPLCKSIISYPFYLCGV